MICFISCVKMSILPLVGFGLVYLYSGRASVPVQFGLVESTTLHAGRAAFSISSQWLVLAIHDFTQKMVNIYNSSTMYTTK